MGAGPSLPSNRQAARSPAAAIDREGFSVNRFRAATGRRFRTGARSAVVPNRHSTARFVIGQAGGRVSVASL
jgi:hypothetical protein